MSRGERAYKLWCDRFGVVPNWYALEPAARLLWDQFATDVWGNAA